MKDRHLPLGIDIGSTRVRIVDAVATPDGPRIQAVAVRDIAAGDAACGGISETHYVAALLEDALCEIRTRQRRCVASIGEPDAVLRTLGLPEMSSSERERSARYEARRFVDFPIEQAVVRIHRSSRDTGTWTVGIARTSALNARLAALRCARLKVISIDHEACALARALPEFDAIVDVGYQRVSLHVTKGETAPMTMQAFNGGHDVTRSIEQELSVDTRTAEKRKRILGTAGAGERARAALTTDIAALIRTARERSPIRRIALVGNGARLSGLVPDLERATGALCELPVSDVLYSGNYPEDVVRSSAPDWTLAVGLALWTRS